jgi:ornithine carbamoyltransferase
MAMTLQPGAPQAARLRHYLSVKDLAADETLALLERARALKAAHARHDDAPLLHGRTLAMIFQKPSLRTRVSFEAGMTQLGGHAIYLGPEDIRLGQRETTEDIAIVLARMSDLIMARVFGHDIVVDLARHATVPVINGLSDREHPCQALGDMLTVLERKGRLRGLRLVFVGDGNNVANSLLLMGGLLGMDVTVACPAGYEPPAEVVAEARAFGAGTGAVLGVTDDLDAACRDADVLYTDVWASMGQEAEQAERKRAFERFTIDARLLALARPDAIVMHCLPAHYGEEIDYAVSRTPNSALFDQAENRLHAQKALLVTLAELGERASANGTNGANGKKS